MTLSSPGCGTRPGFARVVNGDDAAQHSWPWQISLRVRARHICGGSLIKPDWIVTAAYCEERNPSPYNYKVVVGKRTSTGYVHTTINTFRALNRSS